MSKDTEEKKYTIWKYRKDKYYICELLENIESESLKKRIAHELCTYASWAQRYKIVYGVSQCWILLAPLFIVIFSGVMQDSGKLQEILTVSITAVSGIAGVFAFQAKWQHYRTFCELAKQEVQKCVEGLEQYSEKDTLEKEKLLGTNIEILVSQEGQKWKKIYKRKRNK